MATAFFIATAFFRGQCVRGVWLVRKNSLLAAHRGNVFSGLNNPANERIETEQYFDG
jgi:hypothetical protein